MRGIEHGYFRILDKQSDDTLQGQYDLASQDFHMHIRKAGIYS